MLDICFHCHQLIRPEDRVTLHPLFADEPDRTYHNRCLPLAREADQIKEEKRTAAARWTRESIFRERLAALTDAELASFGLARIPSPKDEE